MNGQELLEESGLFSEMAYSRGIALENKNHPNFNFIIRRVFLDHSESQVEDLKLIMNVFIQEFLKKYFVSYYSSGDTEKLEKQIYSLFNDSRNIQMGVPFLKILNGKQHSIKIELMNAIFNFRRVGDSLALSLISGKNSHSGEVHEKGNKILKTMFYDNNYALKEFFYSSKISIPLMGKSGINNSEIVDMNDFYYRLKEACSFFNSVPIDDFIERLVDDYRLANYDSPGAFLSVMSGGEIEIRGKFHHFEENKINSNQTWRKGNLQWKKGKKDLHFNEAFGLCLVFEVKNPYADFNIFQNSIVSDFRSKTIQTLKEVSSILYVQLAAMNLSKHLGL